ncbi:MAG: SUMF1/EgtB/PvdO family nonheme iron enzyme [Bacteroidales bacterium]|nr:SUMF1/EgtB/PvdO family nonheme iron enzyme [Bacteroidales bacterium]
MNKKKLFGPSTLLLSGGLLGILIMGLGNQAVRYTSTDEFCAVCHVHPHVEDSWKKSVHYYTVSGFRTHCVDCHLPPQGTTAYLTEKTKTGLRDLWSYMTKDSADFDWESKSLLENASRHVYNESCIACHPNLFPKELTEEGGTAHLYYEANAEKLDIQCISCHLDAGHYNPNYLHEKNASLAAKVVNAEVYTEPAKIEKFEDFTEYIPGTAVSFNLKAIPGGSFAMGSPDSEPFRKEDEGPVRRVTVKSFFMAEVETSWDEYLAFFSETLSEGRPIPEQVRETNRLAQTADAITGPTPPFGAPDQGWGYGKRPAITMTHYAAEVYCQWLSSKTGKKYRLPTEAEWEYAARGGTETPYFFEGDPKSFSSQGFWRKFFSPDTAVINHYVIYSLNAGSKTKEPSAVGANPFGLKNMSGNVMEYCTDFYAADAYSQTGTEVSDPKGPAEGTEHVVRGGDYTRDAAEVRSAARDYSRHDQWLKTDPQQPKSIWWYSDTRSIGFRVVCEADSLGI